MKKKQYIIPNTAIELLQTERLMDMASISNKGGYGGGAPERRTKAF